MTKPVKISEALRNLLRSLGIEKRLLEAQAAEVWSDVVGPEIDRVTHVTGVEMGVMKVAVRDSLWSQELSLMKADIISKLNERVGGEVIRDIRFR